MTRLAAVTLCIVFLLSGCASRLSNPPQWAVEDTDAAMNVTVRISTTRVVSAVGDNPVFETVTGTGLFISSNDILSVAHILPEDETIIIWVNCAQGEFHAGTVMRIDRALDLAQLRIDEAHKHVVIMSDRVGEWGDKVLIVGVGNMLLRTVGTIAGWTNKDYLIDGPSAHGMSGAGIFLLTKHGPELIAILRGAVDQFTIATRLELIEEFLE